MYFVAKAAESTSRLKLDANLKVFASTSPPDGTEASIDSIHRIYLHSAPLVLSGVRMRMHGLCMATLREKPGPGRDRAVARTTNSHASPGHSDAARRLRTLITGRQTEAGMADGTKYLCL